MDTSPLSETEVMVVPLWKRHPKDHELWQQVGAEADEHWADRVLDTPLEEAAYFVVDLETSGFSAATDKVLSLAAGCARGRELPCAIDQYDIVYHPDTRDIPDFIWELTGLTPQDIQRGKDWKQVLRQALSLAANHVWIAHHARHEVSFLQRHARLLWKTHIRPIAIDTAVVAQALARLPKVPTLDFVCAWLDVPVVSRHSANGDVLMTAEVWKRQIALCQSMGLETVGDVIEFSISYASE